MKNLKEFIALAKSKPGQLNYASSGPGTPYHMAAELFKAMTGTDIVHVPHKTSGDMRTSVLGGHVQMMFDAITVLAPNVREGKVVALGTSGKKRSTRDAGSPDHRRGRRARLRVDHLARRDGAGEDPAGRSSICSMRKSARSWRGRTSRRPGPSRAPMPMTMTPPEFDEVSARRHREVGEGRERAGLVRKK